MKSQQLRKLAPELDSLRLGSGWKIDELSKPQIIVESSYGHSHPGSAHLDQFVEEAMRGITDAGARGARYYTTDICDGIAQGGIEFVRHPRNQGTQGRHLFLL